MQGFIFWWISISTKALKRSSTMVFLVQFFNLRMAEKNIHTDKRWQEE